MSSAATTESGQFTSLIKLSVEELEEKLRVHEFFVKSCKEEIARRKGIKAEKQAEKKAEKKADKKTEKKDDSDKKSSSSTIDATKDDMKAILKKNNIIFKVSSKKEELEDLVRKNNLVRMAQEHKKDRLKTEEK